MAITMRRPASVAATALLLAAVALWPRPGFAQQPPISAEVDRAVASTEDVITLTVTIIGTSNLPTPDLPRFDGVDVSMLSKSTATQLLVFRNQASAQTVSHYRFQATSPGTLTIGPITVTIDGRRYSTTPITIDVLRGPAPIATASPRCCSSIP